MNVARRVQSEGKGGMRGVGRHCNRSSWPKKSAIPAQPTPCCRSAIAARSNLGIAAGGFLSRQVVEQEKCNVHCAMSGGLSVVYNVEGG